MDEQFGDVVPMCTSAFGTLIPHICISCKKKKDLISQSISKIAQKNLLPVLYMFGVNIRVFKVKESIYVGFKLIHIQNCYFFGYACQPSWISMIWINFKTA